ncbi:diaminopimelate epimerase [Legionella gresilensis]|uniref:diaminopimelate epimerase n=1 Tax=Legionella gresilensis TaxID=91823 RepID=UPI001041A040|nr:diaminopimelate epimerase [Legionella gresilensis]
MPLHFTKMHGLGNDFIVIDALRQKIDLSKLNIPSLANRHTGIGFDQCLIVEASQDDKIDFFYRIFNADGQEVGQCGNGARCLARFVKHYGLTTKTQIRIATKTTNMSLQINSDNTVTVDVGQPLFEPNRIPLKALKQMPLYCLPLKNGKSHEVHALSVGNPHAITVVDDLIQTPVAKLGKEISEHPLFPEQTNAGFMKIINEHQIALRVYERGCGETQACGSGALAAAIAAQLFHHLKSPIEVVLLGGNLLVEWSGLSTSAFLTGPATFVYEGRLCE